MRVCTSESVKCALGMKRKFAMHDVHLGLVKFSFLILFESFVLGQCDPVNVYNL